MGTHQNHRMHNHSRLAHKENKRSGRMTQRERLIFELLEKAKAGVTDRQVCEELVRRDVLPHVDMNFVRPRITDLITKRRVVQIARRKDPTTGRPVRVIATRENLEKWLQDNRVQLSIRRVEHVA